MISVMEAVHRALGNRTAGHHEAIRSTRVKYRIKHGFYDANV